MSAAALVLASGCAKEPGLEIANPEDISEEEAAFNKLEQRLRVFLRIQLPGTLKDVILNRKKMANMANELRDDYKAFWDKRAGVLNTAALCRVGVVYDHFARASITGYRNAPVPESIKQEGPATVAEHKREREEFMRQRLLPILRVAGQWYRRCIKQSDKYGVAIKYAEEAKERLSMFATIQLDMP
jgi:hypothetical protein